MIIYIKITDNILTYCFGKVINIQRIESTYGFLLTKILALINPVKKSIKKTECIVHVYLNNKALNILLNDGYMNECNLFKSYIEDLNKGVVWADQDFKSSNHFYNPIKRKGLFGRKNAMDLALNYHEKALKYWSMKKYNKAMFYFGATLHLIQDMTVPQHANIRLLDNHHQYEKFVSRAYQNVNEFKIESGAYLLDSVRDYIRFNSRVAIKIYNKFKNIKDDDTRLYRTTRCCLPLAIRTTAGAMVLFYREIA